MKTSELVERLQGIMQVIGDTEVVVPNYESFNYEALNILEIGAMLEQRADGNLNESSLVPAIVLRA